jgi:glyoxylase-like metal-dependent hydrolase (beta-lactamase superfamily II)
MIRRFAWWGGAIVVAAMVLFVARTHAQTRTPAATPTLAAVADAMGAKNLQTIEYSGSGYSFAFEQAPGPGEPWPLFVVDTYKMSLDYAAPAMRFESTRGQGEHPPRGGAGQPIAAATRSIQFVNGRAAWNENAGRAQPAARAVVDRLRQLWMTPHGIVKAAMAANAKAAPGGKYSFTLEGLPVTLTIGPDKLVEKIEYLVDSAVLGDVPMEVGYSDYRDYQGVKFPRQIVERTDGYLSWDITVADVKPNATVSLARPADLAPAATAPAGPPPAAAPPKVDARQLAPGVWHLVASGYGSMVIEFRDFILMFEGPIDDARSEAVNQWAHTTVPQKPIKYLVNTHAHFDHAGGVRSYVADGVTIITHEMNRSYYENVWRRPHTVKPDKLARAPRAPIWETMTEKKVVSDGTRSLELYKLQGNGHNPYLLIGYLPAEKILLYGDMYNPPAGSDPRDLARTNEYADNLYDNIVNRFKLDVQTLAPIHGLPVPFDNLKKAIGKMPLTGN